MNNFKNIFILLCILFFCACSDNTIEDIAPENNPMETAVFYTGHLNGLVVDENQNPVNSAIIELSGKTTQSDENGFFRFSDATVSENGGLIKITKEGFYDGYKFGFLETDQNSIVKIQLVTKIVVGEVSSLTGGILELPNDASVELPADGVVLDSGGEYTGQVLVYAHYYNPIAGLTLAETMPGDLRGMDTTGAAVQLVTYGMIAVELRGENGQKLQLQEGATATLNFPLTSSDAPDEIPMWFLDEDTGIWNEEGLAIKEGNMMTAQVSHFSFWNCDYPGRLVRVSGRLISRDGSPIAGHLISITSLDNNMSGCGYTNENGIFTGMVPAAIALSLSVTYCQDDNIEIGVLDADTYLGDIVLGPEYVYRIEGQILDCESKPNPNGYLILDSNRGAKVIVPDADGYIDDHFIGCEKEVVTIRAIDTEIGKISSPMTHQYTDNDFDFGTIQTCEDEQFVSYTYGGETYLFEDAEVTIVDGTHVCVFAKDPNNGDKVKFVYPFDPDGYQPEIYSYLDEKSGSGGFQSFEITSPGVAAIGDLFSGTLTISSGFTSELFFRLYVDEIVTTASLALKAWNDIDGNGIHDSGEPVLQNVGVNLLPIDSNLDFSSYFLNLVDSNGHRNFTKDNGILLFEGIIPNTEHYLQYVDYSNTETPTLANQGSDDTLDSDFVLVSPQTYYSQNFTLTIGEVKVGIDLGLLP